MKKPSTRAAVQKRTWRDGKISVICRCAIDGDRDGARFDDAVVRRAARGTAAGILQCTLADLASYVRTLTELDCRGSAAWDVVYFPDRAVPMLPEAAFEWQVCSRETRGGAAGDERAGEWSLTRRGRHCAAR